MKLIHHLIKFPRILYKANNHKSRPYFSNSTAMFVYGSFHVQLAQTANVASMAKLVGGVEKFIQGNMHSKSTKITKGFAMTPTRQTH